MQLAERAEGVVCDHDNNLKNITTPTDNSYLHLCDVEDAHLLHVGDARNQQPLVRVHRNPYVVAWMLQQELLVFTQAGVEGREGGESH